MKFIILCILLVRSAVSVYCPLYCKCHMLNGHRYVGCVDKGLIDIDLDIPTTVQWLQLSNNSISTLHNYDFMRKHLVEVEKLELNGNSIGIIERFAFMGMKALTSLDLSSNHLYYLPPQTFESMNSLYKLDLSINPIRQLPKPFLIVPSLQILFIRSCNLGYISSESFSQMRSLIFLDLSHNQLIQLPLTTIQNLPYLTQIHVSGNHIECGEETMQTVKYTNSKAIRLYGLDCSKIQIKDSSEEDSQTTRKKSAISNNINTSEQNDTFQRMIIIDDKSTSPKNDVYSDNGNLENNNEDETLNRFMKKCQASSITPLFSDSDKMIRNNVHNWLTLIIVFLTGMSIGAVLAYTTVALYTLYWKCHKRRREETSPVHHVQQTYVPSATVFDPNAPPPNYYQLFNLPSRH